jgi:hypothetical protein
MVIYGTTAVGAKQPFAANVRSCGQSGKHMLAWSFSAFDPGCVETLFVPKNCKQPGAMDLDATV